MRIVVVYQREPHARQMAFENVEQPKDRAERVALARRTLAELKLDVEVWIDDLGDQSRALFGDLPHSAIVVDASGTIQVKLPWCDPQVVENALGRLAADATPATQLAHTFTLEKMLTNGVEMPRHQRHSMLAELVDKRPTDDRRDDWLAELAADGPPHQRAWAQAQMPHTTLVDADEKDAIAAAVTERKLLLYAFTGFQCASCRVMEERTFRSPDVRRAMRANLVELRLHTDTRNGLSDARFAANRALQERLAKTRATPYYVVVDPANGAIVDAFALSGGFDTWKDKWLAFVADVAKKAGRAESNEKR